MWRDVLGVQTTLDKREWMYFLETRDQRDEWDVMRFSWFGDYNSAMTFLEIFESSSPQNLPGYSSLKFDKTLATASRSSDKHAAQRLMDEAETGLLSDYPIAPLYFFVSKHLVSSAAQRLMDEAETGLLSDYPIAPLYFFVSKHLVSSRIAGFEDNVMDRHPSRYLRIIPSGPDP
jgi:oligopeptide transport system substrate-binding protein